MAKNNDHLERETCADCGEYNVNCTCEPFDPKDLSDGERLRLGRNLANVQRLQSEFWQALRDLEQSIEELTGREYCELDGAKDFNDLNLEDILAGRANDGEEK